MFGGFKAVVYTTDRCLCCWINYPRYLVLMSSVEWVNLWKIPRQQEFMASNVSTTTWTRGYFVHPILGIWYWCTDQFIVQRHRGERHRHARKGALFGGYRNSCLLFHDAGGSAYAIAQKNPELLSLDGSCALPVDGKRLYCRRIRGWCGWATCCIDELSEFSI